MFGRVVNTFQRRTMATTAQDPIQKLFIDQLKKASKSVYKAGAVSFLCLAFLFMRREEVRR